MEARFDVKTSTLAFGWGSGAMEVDLSAFLPTNQHRLNLFSKALNDSMEYTPLGTPLAGILVLDYIDTAITDTQNAVITHKAAFAAAAADAGLRSQDYEHVLKHLCGDAKLTSALKGRIAPLKQQIAEAKRQMKPAQQGLKVALKKKQPIWHIADLELSLARQNEQLTALERELLPWSRMADAHKSICTAIRKAEQLARNKEYLSQKLKMQDPAVRKERSN